MVVIQNLKIIQRDRKYLHVRLFRKLFCKCSPEIQVIIDLILQSRLFRTKIQSMHINVYFAICISSIICSATSRSQKLQDVEYIDVWFYCHCNSWDALLVSHVLDCTNGFFSYLSARFNSCILSLNRLT